MKKSKFRALTALIMLWLGVVNATAAITARQATEADYPDVKFLGYYQHFDGWSGGSQNGSYYEGTGLISPAFDISQMERPVLALSGSSLKDLVFTSEDGITWESLFYKSKELPKSAKYIKFSQNVKLEYALIVDAKGEMPAKQLISPTYTINNGDEDNSNFIRTDGDLDVSFSGGALKIVSYSKLLDADADLYVNIGSEYINPVVISSFTSSTYYLIPSNPNEVRCISSNSRESKSFFYSLVYGDIKKYTPDYGYYTNLSTNAGDWYDFDLDGKIEVKYSGATKGLVYSVDLERGSAEVATICPGKNSSLINFNNDDYIDFLVPQGLSTKPLTCVLCLGGENYGYSMVYKDNDSKIALNPIDYDNNGTIDFLKSNKNKADDISPNILVVGAYDSIYNAKMQIMTLDEYLGKPQAGSNTGVGIPSISDAMWVPASTTDPESFTSFMTADINGDALPDLIDATYGKIYYNAGNGQWILTDFGGKVMLRDLNEDGISDYIIYDSSNKTVTSYICQKDATPKQQKLVSNMVCGNKIWCYDFDKDNDVDVLIPFNYTDNKGSYLLLMENKGDGTFKKHENYIEDKADFCECLDIDGDGNYEVIASCETTDKSTSSSSVYIYNSRAYEISGTKVNATGEIICKKIAENSSGNSYELLVADIYNSGLLNMIIDAKSLAPISKVANRRPNAPAKLDYYYDSSTGLLKISWERGSDTESSPLDLTYALRIGSAPDKGDYLFAHALPDGTRRNLFDGNQGYALQRVIDTSTWPAGKYYISVQAVDPNHLGSQFSEYAVFEKSMPENGFELSYKKPFAIHDTCMVYLTNAPVDGYVYNWNFDGAEVLSKNEDGSIYKLAFSTPGEKHISLQVATSQGVLSVKKEQILAVSQANIKSYSPVVDGDGTEAPQIALDIDEDGVAEAQGYSDNKFMNSNADDTFTTIKRLWNNNTNLSKFNRPATIDINNDGMCDVISTFNSDIYHLTNLGDGDMEVSDLLAEYNNLGSTVVDIDNDGFYDYIYESYRLVSINSGDYINFTQINNYIPELFVDSYLYDYNKDGLIDNIYEKRGDTIEGFEFYAYINLGNAFMHDDKKIFHITGEPITMGDFDNDGGLDLVYNGYDGDTYLHKIQWSDGTNGLITSAPYKLYNDEIFVFDFDNNGYLDIYDTYNHWIVLTSANRKFTIEKISNEDATALSFDGNIIPFKSASGNLLLTNGDKVRIKGSNERPTAPTGLRSQQTESAVILEWNPSTDKETASCNMQYNLSVKRKGASGEGAYLFSPCNSTKNGVPVPSHKPLISSTMFTIPIANIPAGEYEVQVQGVDGWREASDFSEVYNLVVKESINLQMATTTGVNVKVQATLTGNTTPTIDWGEASVEQVSSNTYNLTWNTPGMKPVSVDGELYKIYVKPSPDGAFNLPETVLANATININGQNMYFGIWEVAKNNSNDYVLIENCDFVKLVMTDSENAVVSFLESGDYILRHTVNDEYNTIQYTASTNVVDDVTTQEIAIVSIDAEIGKHVIKWNETSIPTEALSVNIYKETSRVNEYKLIDNVAIGTQSYVDLTSTPEASASRYRLSYVLSYGESELSEAHQAMHVMINRGIGNSWNLMWSKYEGMEVASYRILRGTSSEELSVIAEVSGNMSSYSDLEVNEEDVLYYAVEIVSSNIVPMSAKTTSLSSRSNVVSVINAPSVEFINAISVVPVDGITTEINSIDNLSLKLKANINPTWATLQRVNWIVYSGEDIATIDQSGVLTANGKANGEVVVRAYAIDGSGVYGEITINVMNLVSKIDNVNSGNKEDDSLKYIHRQPIYK